MRFHCIFVLCFLAASLLGNLAKPLTPHWDDMRTKHTWNTVPKNWESRGHPPSGTTIDLYIALKPHHESAIVDALYEVSEPTHPRYRAYLTKEQVAELAAPHPQTLELVYSWLEHHGIPSSSISMTHGGGNTMKLKGVSVTQANALLGASYQIYKHVERSETIVRTVGYALPAALHRHVLTVAPTTTFVSPPTQRQTPRNLSGGAAAGRVKPSSGEPAAKLSSRMVTRTLTPTFLRWKYGTAAYTPKEMGRNVLGIASYLSDYPSPTDLTVFMRKFRFDAEDATFSVVQVNNGGYDPSNPTMEGNVNVQYAQAIAYPTPLIFYSTGQGPEGTDDWFTSWLEFILDQQNIPYTISSSYGFDENDLPKDYAKNLCEEFAKLGLRGVSVLFPSGNGGVGEGTCVTKDGSAPFRPQFPATCPYVTAVGGTTNYAPEIAAKISGGGFSNFWLVPPYQQRVVPPYVQNLGDQYKGRYNSTGRGIPDISAQAFRYQTINKGNQAQFSGTSAATPTVAAIISLLNDWLLSRGQEPLGFLNPWLYGRGFESLTDIRSGTNPGCGTPGFTATAGWDPVTGIGTPDFPAMQDVLRRYPYPYDN